MQLYEKYRPKSFENVIGQAKAIRQIESVAPYGGKAFFISGASGTGKTTLARIIAATIAQDWCIEELDSADDLSVERIDTIERTMYLYGAGKGGRAFIVNEFHGARANIVRKLLGILERIPNHVVFVFTSTKEGQLQFFDGNIDANPLMSRCIYIGLSNQGLAKPFAEHCKKIAQIEGLDGQSPQAYYRLAQECKNNMRMMLQAIEAGEMKG